MRVLHIIGRLNVGGTARYITQLVNELPKHGIETFVATGYVQGAEIEDKSAQSIDLIRVPSMGRSINPMKDYFAHKQLDKIIDEVKPDIIHTHTFKAGLLVRMRKQIVPIIHTYHGHLLDDPEFNSLKKRAIVVIERMLAKNSTKLVTVGYRVGNELLGYGIGNRSQYVNIPPGVAPVKFTPKQQALVNLNIQDQGKPLIGWIARATGVKNPMRVLEVAKELPDYHFVMAGGGDLLNQIKSAAPPNVDVVGWAEAADLLGVSDVILSTSENEGMPIALIEAQLAGKPVVATDVGSVAEIILDQKTGFITNKKPADIAFAIASIMADKNMRDDMGRRGSNHARATFSVEVLIQNHKNLYREVIAITQ